MYGQLSIQSEDDLVIRVSQMYFYPYHGRIGCVQCCHTIDLTDLAFVFIAGDGNIYFLPDGKFCHIGLGSIKGNFHILAALQCDQLCSFCYAGSGDTGTLRYNTVKVRNNSFFRRIVLFLCLLIGQLCQILICRIGLRLIAIQDRSLTAALLALHLGLVIFTFRNMLLHGSDLILHTHYIITGISNRLHVRISGLTAADIL